MKKIKRISSKNLPPTNPLFIFLAVLAYLIATERKFWDWELIFLAILFIICEGWYLINIFMSKEVDIFKFLKKGNSHSHSIMLDGDKLKDALKKSIDDLDRSLKSRKIVITEIGSGEYDINFENKTSVKTNLTGMEYFRNKFTIWGCDVEIIPLENLDK